MPAKTQRSAGQPALDLLEEAIHLLRLMPLGFWLPYFLGTLPFIIGFLFFWADMSRSAFAERHAATSALGMALLLIWMRTWQTVFASRLREHVSQSPRSGWTARRWFRALIQQAAVQPLALFVLPVAFVLTLPLFWTYSLTKSLPFGWCYAFFHNYAIFGDGRSSELQPIVRRASGQAALWQGQNLGILITLILLGLIGFVNMLAGILMVPGLLKTFLGVESYFTQSGLAVYNSTLMMAALALVYLAIDLLLRAVYVLRCFYGESLVTGEDLKVQLRASSRLAAVAAVICLLFVGTPSSTSAETADQQETTARISATQLDASIEKTIAKREFAWRLPRENLTNARAEENWVQRFVSSLHERFTKWAISFRDGVRNLLEWLEKRFLRDKDRQSASHSSSGTAWMDSLQWLLFILVAVLLSIVAILIYRVWQQRRRKPEVVLAEAIPAIPNLENEDVTASQLPEDGWMRLARELMERGELRLALRALYLASLAHLAHREFVQIAKFKSNREYENELRRRARAFPELQSAFAENVSLFDSVWYGMHEITGEGLQHFQQNLERIRQC